MPSEGSAEFLEGFRAGFTEGYLQAAREVEALLTSGRSRSKQRELHDEGLREQQRTVERVVAVLRALKHVAGA